MELVTNFLEENSQRKGNLNDSKVIWEICIHEASHIVINEHYHKLGLSRKTLKDVTVMSTGIGSEVNYTLSDGDKSSTHESIINHPEYFDPMIITLLAGYFSSYVYINKVDDWISTSSDDTVYYTDLKNAVYSTRISDFRKVRELLLDYRKTDIRENLKVVNDYLSELSNVFNIESVKKTIHSLAEIIRNNINKKIEADEISSLLQKV